MAPPKESTLPAKASPAAGDETRSRLIGAGLDVFGKNGYEASTTRMLAKAAGVNLAAIPYHFGGKEGLYHAVVKHIAESLSLHLAQERNVAIAAMMNPAASREELLGALEALVRGFGRVIVCSELGGKFGPIIAREQMEPSAAFDHLYMSEMRFMHEGVSMLVGRLTGSDPRAPETIIRTHAIFGQVLAFRAAREVALRRLGWDNFSPENTEKVCDVIVENMRRLLGGEGASS